MTATLWLVFARGLGFFARAPGFGRQNVPAIVRVAFGFALALAVAPSQPRIVEHDAAAFVVAAACELLTGAAMGIAATLVAEAAGAAARLLDDFVGLRASVPQVAVAPPGFGGLWSLVFVAGFFALGGIDMLIVAFADSFHIVPLASAANSELLRSLGLSFGAKFARLALELAAPALCVALCIQLGFAALARVIPRFGHLSVAYPLAYAGVLLLAFASLSSLRELAILR